MKSRTLALVWILLAADLAHASGYHPFFDEALEKAQVVVLGTVTDAWRPRPLAAGKKLSIQGRLYRLKVEQVFKGVARAGDEIVFWDRYASSTASYHVAEGARNLTFLVPVDPSGFEQKNFDFGASRFYAPIRNLDDRPDWRPDELRAWLRLLDLRVVRPPGDLLVAYREILEKEENRYLLNYAIEHWPRELTPDDRKLFSIVVDKFKKDAWVAAPAIRALGGRGKGIGERKLLDLMKHGSPLQREELLLLIGPANIASCREVMWEWLLEDNPDAEQATIDALAKLARDFVLAKLRERELPFWKQIPLLQALKIDGREVGRESYPAGILALSPYLIRNVGAVFRGEEFYGILAMGEPGKNRDWGPAFPLLAPLLKKDDTPIRRMVVALMRTFGVEVWRSGAGYQANLAGRTMPPPIRLRIETGAKSFRAGQSIPVRIIESAAMGGGWLSFDGELGWSVEREGGPSTYTGGPFRVFEEVSAPRDRFALLKKDGQRSAEQDLSSYADRPGRYQVRVRKVYFRDGASAGLDAWTGMVFSEPIEIEVTD